MQENLWAKAEVLLVATALSMASGMTKVLAATATVDGVTWTYTVSSGKASVGNGNCAVPTSTTGAISIPSTLGGYPVTSIGSFAFYECKRLTNVLIPDCVTNIGEWAFYNCTKLTSVIIPDGVTRIEDGVFCECSGLTSVTIPNNVGSIGEGSFSDCRGLTNATIPNSVRDIGNSAFSGCDNLKSVTIGNGVKHIADYAFGACTKLTNVTIPDNVTHLGERVFSGCSGLTNAIIRNGSIGEEAFYECIGLMSVTIGNSVTDIGKFAFSGCDRLRNVMIPDSVTNIGWGAFDCDELEVLYVPKSWEGVSKWTAMLESAYVPETCRIVYYDSLLEETSSTPIAVPFAWLNEKAAGILAANGGDYEAAAMATARNKRPVWECYVADVDPESGEDFKAEITWKEGELSLSPSVKNEGRFYTWEGADLLGGEEVWGPTNAASRFFRVKVSLVNMEDQEEEGDMLRVEMNFSGSNSSITLTVPKNTTYTFQIIGGAPPYRWTRTGVGSLENGALTSQSRIFHSGNQTGTTTLTVTDSTLRKISAYITVVAD
jgi:hypothetical protein